MFKIVPCLDVKEGRVVKGVRFVDLKDAGDPSELARAYMEAGADELVFLDIAATTDKRSTKREWVERVASVIGGKIPFTVGGGVSSLETAQELIDLGADKIGINSAAVKNPDFLEKCARILGPGRVVLAIDVREAPSPDSFKRWEVLVNGGKTSTGMDLMEWVWQTHDMGIDSFLPTALDRDGTKNGYDLELLSTLRAHTALPIIASGGAGTMEHFAEAARAGASAGLAASVFHFGEIKIPQLKAYLAQQGIEVAPVKGGK